MLQKTENGEWKGDYQARFCRLMNNSYFLYEGKVWKKKENGVRIEYYRYSVSSSMSLIYRDDGTHTAIHYNAYCPKTGEIKYFYDDTLVWR